MAVKRITTSKFRDPSVTFFRSMNEKSGEGCADCGGGSLDATASSSIPSTELMMFLAWNNRRCPTPQPPWLSVKRSSTSEPSDTRITLLIGDMISSALCGTRSTSSRGLPERSGNWRIRLPRLIKSQLRRSCSGPASISQTSHAFRNSRSRCQQSSRSREVTSVRLSAILSGDF